MMSPLVSIVTPVYNGAPYLRECINCVLAQTYEPWDYTIVNNCSTDDSLAIAEEYVNRDPRIRVINNSRHMPVVANHNIAIRAISPESKYCKVILADDWMFPNCLSSMVKLIEEHPTVGVVGAYGLCGTKVAWDGLPYPSTVVCGRSICRASLLGELSIFGSQTSTMFRSDLVRERDPFYNESNLRADREACYETLKHSDFGFVHEVLTFTRVDNESLRTEARRLNIQEIGLIEDLIKFGYIYLTEFEYKQRLKHLWNEYYKFLAWTVFPRKPREFWLYQHHKLQEIRHPLSRLRLLKAVVARGVDAALNPKRSLERVWEMYSRSSRKEGRRMGPEDRNWVPISAPDRTLVTN
jgi:glycosyltransferase involved in cell wall biosynthesis